MKRLIRKSDFGSPNNNQDNTPDNQDNSTNPATPPMPPQTPANNPNTKALEGAIAQLSEKGREILRSLEDYKFTVEQVARLTQGNQELAKKVIDKQKMVDQASAQIYTVVFDMENLDITTMFAQQQVVTFNPSSPDNKDDDGKGDDKKDDKPNQPATPPNGDSSDKKPEEKSDDKADDKSTEKSDDKADDKADGEEKSDTEPPKKSHHKKPENEKSEDDKSEDTQTEK